MVLRHECGAKGSAVHRAVPDQYLDIRRQQAMMREKLLQRAEATKDLMNQFYAAANQLGNYCRLKPDLKYDGALHELAKIRPVSGVRSLMTALSCIVRGLFKKLILLCWSIHRGSTGALPCQCCNSESLQENDTSRVTSQAISCRSARSGPLERIKAEGE